MRFLTEEEFRNDNTSMVGLNLLMIVGAGIPYHVLKASDYRYRLDGNKLVVEMDVSYHGSPCYDKVSEVELSDAQVAVINHLTDDKFIKNLKILNLEKELKSVTEEKRRAESKLAEVQKALGRRKEEMWS